MTICSLSRASRRLAIGAFFILLATCSSPPFTNQGGGGEEPNSALTALRREALVAMSDNVVIAEYEEFERRSGALRRSCEALAQAPQDDSKLNEAQASWREAMTSWQRAEVFQFGPAGVMGEVAGGQDLRDLIYSWPLVNPCRLDQEIAKNAFAANADYLETQLVNTRGLDALEYLLFYRGEQNACAPNATLNRSGDWDALSAPELAARRAKLAAAAAVDLEGHAKALRRRWTEGDASSFREQLVGAGQRSDTYASTQEALNAISDAMFYVEKETKDMKLATPLGIKGCDQDSCPEALEHPHAAFSLQASRQNHLAFERLYLGADPSVDPDAVGFDDLLRQANQGALDEQIRDALQRVLRAHDAVPGSFSEALIVDREALKEVYDASKALGVLLKTQFISVLDLELPQRAEGDND